MDTKTANLTPTEVAEYDPRVSPSVVKANVQWNEIFITDFVLTVLAGFCRIRVVEIASERIYEIASPILTSLPRRGIKDSKLVACTYDRKTTDVGC